MNLPCWKRCLAVFRVDVYKRQVLGITRENLTGVRVIRAFCKEENEINEFSARNQALTKTQKYVGRISALMNPLTYIDVYKRQPWF